MTKNFVSPNFNVVRQWVSRAGALPLDISVRFGRHSDVGFRELQELYVTLQECANQWQVIRLLAVPRDLFTTLSAHKCFAIGSILQKLEISGHTWRDSSESNSKTIPMPGHSPSDVCLRLPYPSMVELDWKSLTSFTGKFCAFDLGEMLNLPEVAPLLRHFNVTHIKTEHQWSSHRTTTFQHLQSQTMLIQYTPGTEYDEYYDEYDINSTDSIPVEDFLTSIRLPALISLSLQGPYAMAASSLQELFEESYSPIEELVLSDLHFTEEFNGEALLDLLTTISQLKSLTIIQGNFREEPCLTSPFFD